MTTKRNKKILIIALICLFISSVEKTSNIQIIENNTSNKTLEVAKMSMIYDAIEEKDLNKAIYTYQGDLTGYGANCKACGGHLGCNGMDVRDGRTTYKDSEYGTVRIVASSKKIKCGSIVKFNFKKEEITAIVLDRGVTGYDLDLLVESESYASKYVGRKHISYDIVRNGWDKKI